MLAEQIEIIEILGHHLGLHLNGALTFDVQKLGHLGDFFGAQAHEVPQRLGHHIIKTHHDGQRQQHGQTAGQGADPFLIIELLHFLSVFFPVVGVLFLQFQHLGLDALHIHHTLFLFPVKGEQDDLGQKSEEDNGKAIAAHPFIDKAHNVSERDRYKIKHRSSPSAKLQNPVKGPSPAEGRTLFCYGTGSYPPLQNGLQRNMRHRARAPPFKRPYFSIASKAY